MERLCKNCKHFRKDRPYGEILENYFNCYVDKDKNHYVSKNGGCSD